MCGIAGIVSKNKKPFDFSTFCMLGIENDSRGGDSCGVFIDGRYEYGVNKEKLFCNYFQNSNLIYKTKASRIALVHCRKASVGKISEETAQPVIIKDKRGAVSFVVMHNGTIYNYKELAEKYIPNVDITGMTDSQVMAHIFYHSGYDALSEYHGGAVFCIVDYRYDRPRIFFFKGASKKNTYSKEIEEERPLYYCIDTIKKELVFSSLWLPIIVSRKNCKLFTPKENTLIEFVGASMRIIKEYPRTNCTQSKSVGKEVIPRYYDYSWDYYTSPYVSVDFDKNTYSHNGKYLHGRKFISKYGKLFKEETEDTAYEAYFYNGVLLRDKESFEFLTKIQEDKKMSIEDFYKKYWNVIRFLSYDKIFNSGGFYYEATSPNSSRMFTGTLDPITTTSSLAIVDGRRGRVTYNRDYEAAIKNFYKAKDDINFKEILKIC